MNKKARLQDDLKSYAAHIKGEIAAADAQINLLSGHLRTGKEIRSVKCTIEYNWTNFTKKWVRGDTGDEAKNDIISEYERQEELKLNKLEPENAPE